ncbi:MAG: Piwi domain-containing protein [Actinomycetota bacterium]|nr:Piwi domain-containing protein [Actinomycetota bacterium]
MVAAADVLFPAHKTLHEPSLAVGNRSASVGGKTLHPLRGLVEHGPYSASALGTFAKKIRVALISPADEISRVRGLFRELTEVHRPRERRDYLIDFPGFNEVFGVQVVPAHDRAHVVLPSDLDDRVASSGSPHGVLAEAMTEALSAAAAIRMDFDVVAVRLPDRWARGFVASGSETFDLHDYIKADAASRGIATQLLRDRAFDYFDRCSVAWRLGIALYVKAGGVPWKLADFEPDTAFFGIGYSLGSGAEGNRFVRCCSQVFEATGTGLEFVAFEVDETELAGISHDNPFFTRDQMRTVMARSLQLYQTQHAGRLPRRVVVHKTTPFKPSEIEGSFDALGQVGDVDLLHVQRDVRWRAVRGIGQGKPDRWPCHRGTLVFLSQTELLLWTQGNAPSVSARGNYFKEGRGIPAPLMVTRYAGHEPAERVASELLGLTKMDWNNDGLYDRLPVTIDYARKLARTIRRIPRIHPGPHPFRLFM